MARKPRVDAGGMCYHVINRGNNQTQIFKNNRGKEKFLENLEKAVGRFSIDLKEKMFSYNTTLQTINEEPLKSTLFINESKLQFV